MFPPGLTLIVFSLRMIILAEPVSGWRIIFTWISGKSVDAENDEDKGTKMWIMDIYEVNKVIWISRKVSDGDEDRRAQPRQCHALSTRQALPHAHTLNRIVELYSKSTADTQQSKF